MLAWLSLLVACATEDMPPAQLDGCPDGQVAAGDACVPAACGTGTWGDLPVDESTVYVAPGGTGDGSASSPLGSIQAAADLAGERGGGLVALAEGTYEGNVALDSGHDGVRIAGVCRERVRLVGRPRDRRAVVDVAGTRRKPDVAVSGVTLAGGADFGLGVTFARVTVEGVDIVENAGGGVIAVGGAVVEASDTRISDNVQMGLYAADVGTTVSLLDIEVTDTAPNADGAFGRGIEAGAGAEVRVERALVARNADNGIRSAARGTRIEVFDTEILDTRLNGDGKMGRGAVAMDGGALTCERCLVRGAHYAGVVVADVGSTVDLVDTRVQDVLPQEDGRYGDGLAAYDGAVLRGTRVTVERSHQLGLYVSAGASAELSDSELLDTDPTRTSVSGYGVSVRSGATARLTDVTVRGSLRMGLLASEQGSVLEVEGGVVEGTRLNADGTGGWGAWAREGARIALVGTTVADHGEMGVVVSEPGSVLTLRDARVTGNSGSTDSRFGWGLHAYGGGELVATDTVVEGVRELGVMVAGGGTRATLTRTEVVGTRRSRSTTFAVGVYADSGADLVARRSTVRGTQGPGIYLYSGATASLSGCAITGNGFAGVMALGGSMTIEDATIEDNGPDAARGGGVGVYASTYFSDARLRLLDSFVGPHRYAAAWLDGPGAYELLGNELSGSDGVPMGSWSAHGNAVYVWGGATPWDGIRGTRVEGNTFLDATGVAVLLNGASAALVDNAFTRNEQDVWQQRCEFTIPLEAPSARWSVCEGGALLTDDSLRFGTLYVPEAAVEQ